MITLFYLLVFSHTTLEENQTLSDNLQILVRLEQSILKRFVL